MKEGFIQGFMPTRDDVVIYMYDEDLKQHRVLVTDVPKFFYTYRFPGISDKDMNSILNQYPTHAEIVEGLHDYSFFSFNKRTLWKISSTDFYEIRDVYEKLMQLYSTLCKSIKFGATVLDDEDRVFFENSELPFRMCSFLSTKSPYNFKQTFEAMTGIPQYGTVKYDPKIFDRIQYSEDLKNLIVSDPDSMVMLHKLSFLAYDIETYCKHVRPDVVNMGDDIIAISGCIFNMVEEKPLSRFCITYGNPSQ